MPRKNSSGWKSPKRRSPESVSEGNQAVASLESENVLGKLPPGSRFGISALHVVSNADGKVILFFRFKGWLLAHPISRIASGRFTCHQFWNDTNLHLSRSSLPADYGFLVCGNAAGSDV